MKQLRPATRYSFTVLLIVFAMLTAILSLPVRSYAFGTNSPTPYAGAPGQGTCASCHGTLTAGSGVMVNAPKTYTPGGAAIPLTVTIPSSGGFELEVGTQASNAQAGTLAAGTNVTQTINGLLQFVTATAETTSWTFNWTPPATNVGNVVVYVTGGSLGTNYSNSFVMTPAAAPDFSLSASPTSVSIAQAKTGTSTMTVTPTNGFTGTVSYSASGLPSGVTASFSGNTLTLTASSTATVGGPSTVTITGTSGTLSHTTTVALTVTAPAPAPDFSLSASPTSLTIAQGASGSSTLTVTKLNGFTGAVTFTASGLPTGVTAAFTSTAVTLTASSTAAAGASTVTITGTSGALVHTATVSLTVTAPAPAPNFSLAASPTSLTIAQGASGSSTLTVTKLNGFTGTVTFTASGLPTGVTAAFTSTAVTLTASSTAAAGTSTVTITGTSGTLTHTATISLTVSASAPAPNFSLSASPSSLTIGQGASGTSNVTVTNLNGFTGSVALSASGMPSGVTASFASTTLTLTASSTAATGTSTVSITGTSGLLTHTIMLSLTVTGTTGTSGLVVSPSSLTFNYQNGVSTSGTQSLNVNDTTAKTWYYVSTSGGSWLTASPNRGRTPGTITVSVNAYNMTPGTYSGMVHVSTSGAIQTSVQVTLNVTSGGCVTNCGGGGTPSGMYAQPYVSDSQSGTLAAAWVNNMGATPLSTTDPLNRGLVLEKAATAPADAMAGAKILNVTGMNLTELGFYLRAVVPCGPDAPQFLVVTTDAVMHWVGGCTSNTTTPPSPAPAGWTNLHFDPAKATPPITTGVQSISLVIGKGTTPPTGSLAVIDNIEVNGVVVGKGSTYRDE